MGAEVVDGVEGGQVAEVVAGVEERGGGGGPGVGGEGDALVHAGRAQFEDHAARFEAQAVPVGEVAQRVAQGGERGLRVGGAAGVHRDGPAALLLDPRAVGRAEPLEQAGEFGAGGRDAGMVAGGVEPAGCGVPAFGAVVAQDDQPVQAGDVGEAAVFDGGQGRTAGEHHDRAEPGRQRGQRGDGAGLGAGLLGVGDDGGEGAVEVEDGEGAVRRASSASSPARPCGVAGAGSSGCGGRPMPRPYPRGAAATAARAGRPWRGAAG